MTHPIAWSRIAMCCVALSSLIGACGDDAPTKCSDGDDSCAGSSQDSSGDDESDAPKKDGGKADAGSKKDATVSSSKDAGASTDKGANLPCDVAAIVTKNCGTCHGADTAFGAPMPLTTAADFAADGVSDKSKSVADLVKTRINATDVTKRMPPSPGKLSADDLKTLNAWLDSGAAGTDTKSCTGAGGNSDAGTSSASDAGDDWLSVDAGDPHADPNLTCYKLLSNDGKGGPFSVGVARDAYYNVTFAAPWKGTVYARVISPVIDNMKAIHHWLLFEDDSPGQPGAPVRGSGAHPSGQLIMGWAPGGPATDFRPFPDDLGFELPGNTTYTIEFHYNSTDAAAKDASGAEICVGTTKPKNIVGLSWLGNDNLFIPSTSWSGTCAPQSLQPIHIVGVNPHMHLQGRHQKAVINRAGGKQEVLNDVDFDFNYQISYTKNVVINPGDTITTTCTFAQPMTFGESTTAEMCYMFTLAYPKGALTDNGGWGSIAHGGSSCLGQ